MAGLSLKSGALVGDQILNYEEFYAVIKPVLMQNFEIFLNAIQGLKAASSKKELYVKWESFKQIFLLNKKVSVLFIGNLMSDIAGNMDFKYGVEENLLSEQGYFSSFSKMESIINSEQNSFLEQVQKHLYGFQQDVESQNLIYSSETDRVFNEGTSKMKQRANAAKYRTNNWTYKNIIYGEGENYQGQVADAFLQHMGQMHVQVLAAMLKESGEIPMETIATSVFNENRHGIYDLLINSKNSTGWYSGGDLIAQLSNGEILNVQLKTALGEKKKISQQISTKRLLQVISSIETLLTKDAGNIDNVIQKLFNLLKTSGYVEKAEELSQATLQKLEEDILNSVKNIPINIGI